LGVTSPQFSLTISLNVLEHLGINLYSNVPSVLSEIVANAWDADADTVTVDWDRSNDKIVISDDGTGMTPDEVNQRS
jgi:HSP90 family molecular chaperone